MDVGPTSALGHRPAIPPPDGGIARRQVLERRAGHQEDGTRNQGDRLGRFDLHVGRMARIAALPWTPEGVSRLQDRHDRPTTGAEARLDRQGSVQDHAQR